MVSGRRGQEIRREEDGIIDEDNKAGSYILVYNNDILHFAEHVLCSYVHDDLENDLCLKVLGL